MAIRLAAILVLALIGCLALGGSAQGYEHRALILVDEFPGGGASTSQEVLENLLGHFDLPYDVKLLDDYAAGDIESHRVTFYLGSTWDRELPAAFMADVMATDQRVVWINHNIWRLEWSQYEAAFHAKYGFTFIQTRSTGAHDKVSFQGRTFTRLQDSFGQTQILDPSRAAARGSITGGSGSYPYIIKSGNLYYVADDPMEWIGEDTSYLVFTEVLHDMVGIDHPVSHRAMVRIEDVDPNEDPDRIRAIADYLYAQGVPFSLAVIPRFEDPLGAWGAPTSIGISQKPQLVSALQYAVSRGGTIVLHGYTHQYGSVANPWNGVTGVDTEFYIQQSDGNGGVVAVGPVPGDSIPWVNGRIDAALAELQAAGLPQPHIWETPHYLASDLDNQVFADRFRVVYQRFTDAYFPYIIGRSVYGSRVLPENLGYIDASLAPPSLMLARGDRSLVIRDGFASFFFHSEKDINLLKQTVAGLKAQGYSFVSAASLMAAEPADNTPPSVSGVSPTGVLTASPTQVSAAYSDNGAGIDPLAVDITLDGVALAGCAVSATGASCPVSGVSTGQHVIGGSVGDNAGNTAPISGGFEVGDARPDPYLFAEAFTDGDASGWAPEGWGGSTDWRVWSLGGEQVYAGRVTDFAWSLNGPESLTDQVFETDIAFTGDTTTAGLAFRATGSLTGGSYYYFGLYPGQNKWKLYSVNSGDWGNGDVPLAEGSYSLTSGTIYRLKVSARGNKIDLFINGQALAGGSITNSDHPAGRFGPWLAQGAAYYDDLLVTSNGYSFADDFSDGDSSGWQLEPAGSWSVAAPAGNYLLKAVSDGSIASAWAGPETLRDQGVAADVTFDADNATAGLAFRSDGRVDGSYYYFGLYPREGRWRLYSVVNGSWGDPDRPLAQGSLALVPGNVYRLRAAAVGDSVTLSVNGQPLAGGSLTLNGHRAGYFGPWMAVGSASFDNITVDPV